MNDNDYRNKVQFESPPTIPTSLGNGAIYILEGKAVMFNPAWKTIKDIEGKFVLASWSPEHIPQQAGTMGFLCNSKYKALADSLTDIHADWQ